MRRCSGQGARGNDQRTSVGVVSELETALRILANKVKSSRGRAVAHRQRFRGAVEAGMNGVEIEAAQVDLIGPLGAVAGEADDLSAERGRLLHGQRCAVECRLS